MTLVNPKPENLTPDTQEWSDRPDITKDSGGNNISKAVTEA